MTGNIPDGLQLTEEEAFALLSLCLTSTMQLDATSEKAVRKLAAYCSVQQLSSNHHSVEPSSHSIHRGLERAGA